MTPRKKYIKPELSKIILDKSISLVMMTVPSNPPDPRGGSSPPSYSPFKSPFSDKPFG
jgi:hypothetical protein